MIVAVGKASEYTDGVVCASNLYIQAANCGRRCNPEERVTMSVFVGGKRTGRGAPSGPFGSVGALLDGIFGLVIFMMVFLRMPVKIGPESKDVADAWEFGQFGFYALGGKYAVELVGDIMG